jgi:hypothetical protein
MNFFYGEKLLNRYILYLSKLFDAFLFEEIKIKVFACFYEITCQF